MWNHWVVRLPVRLLTSRRHIDLLLVAAAAC
jgi:hypothetical protein